MKNAIRMSVGDRVFLTVVYVLVTLMIVIFLYPLLFVVSTSFSDGARIVSEGNVNFLPRGFSALAYERILKLNALYVYYGNSLLYAFGTMVLCLVISTLTAYPLTKRDLPGGKVLVSLFTFTLFFSGGLIPSYILMKDLGLNDTRWVMIIPGALNVWNIIVFRTFFKGLPLELEESAMLDGASYFTILARIILPLSTPMLATFAIFAIVGSWNDFFMALIYLRTDELMPLQMYLRKVLIQLDSKMFMVGQESMLGDLRDVRPVRAASIVVSCLPIMMVYPFFQKYFTKGMIVGSLKG